MPITIRHGLVDVVVMCMETEEEEKQQEEEEEGDGGAEVAEEEVVKWMEKLLETKAASSNHRVNLGGISVVFMSFHRRSRAVGLLHEQLLFGLLSSNNDKTTIIGT
jgi:hypothetical protein